MSSESFANFRLRNELSTIQLLNGASLKEIVGEEKYATVFEYRMSIYEGVYEGRTLKFLLRIPHAYPFKAPKLFCTDKVFHPNIDTDGNVCLELLRLGWRPGFGLEDVFVNLHLIFIDISGEDPLNKEAGEMFISDYKRFVRMAKGVEKRDEDVL